MKLFNSFDVNIWSDPSKTYGVEKIFVIHRNVGFTYLNFMFTLEIGRRT
jgi:hypothetical protein